MSTHPISYVHPDDVAIRLKSWRQPPDEQTTVLRKKWCQKVEDKILRQDSIDIIIHVDSTFPLKHRVLELCRAIINREEDTPTEKTLYQNYPHAPWNDDTSRDVTAGPFHPDLEEPIQKEKEAK